MTNCKHNLPPGCCDLCKNTGLESPLPIKPFFLKSNGIIGLILDTPIEAGTVEVFLATDKDEIIKIDKKEINIFSETELTKKHRDKLLTSALKSAFIITPTVPLTFREQIEEGPPHCWYCKERGILRTLSYEKHSLGCSKCSYYVCICGSCLCDYEGGKNWQGGPTPKGCGLPCDKLKRQKFIRIIRALSGVGWVSVA